MIEVSIAKTDGRHRHLLNEHGSIDYYDTEITMDELKDLASKAVKTERANFAHTLLTYMDNEPVRVSVRLHETTKASENVIQYVQRCQGEKQEQMSLF